MKTIALLRHAKSDWGSSELRDIDRPLATRGQKQAPMMGSWLKSHMAPELALVSPATRAQQTFEATGLEAPSQTVDSLYPTQAGNLLRILQDLSNDVSEVLIVGHNPGISNAVNTMLAQVSDDPKLEEMPTCACAILTFDHENWGELGYSQAKLTAFMTPKRLKRTEAELQN